MTVSECKGDPNWSGWCIMYPQRTNAVLQKHFSYVPPFKEDYALGTQICNCHSSTIVWENMQKMNEGLPQITVSASIGTFTHLLQFWPGDRTYENANLECRIIKTW
jgi:hypothetical protein